MVDPVTYQKEHNYIEGEQAVIIWDSAHQIEHFIRQADIHTDALDVGFLVPTPQTPELAAADPRIFKLAAEVARPTIIPDYVYHHPLPLMGKFLWGPAVLALTETIGGMSEEEESPVISQVNVGDYRATILKAEDGAALKRWLADNGLRANASVQAWLQPYIAAKWKLTAFRLARRPVGNHDHLASRAIRMTFPTNQPFFPYSEPSDQRSPDALYPSRYLSLAILSGARMDGAMTHGETWPVQLRYAGSLDTTGTTWKNEDWLTFSNLAASIYPHPTPRYLTYFRDESTPRQGTSDLVFTPSQDQSNVRWQQTNYNDRRERINWSSPGETLVGLFVAVLVTVAPLYGGLRVWQRSGLICPATQYPSSYSLIVLDRFAGVALVAVGTLETFIYVGTFCVLCSGIFERDFPGQDLLGVHLSPLIIFLCLCLVYCGIRLLSRRERPRTNGEMFREATAGTGSVVFGIAATIVLFAAVLSIDW